MSKHILAIDQGTSSSRAVVFDASMNVVSSAQLEFAQHYPEPGWVEHDAGEIWTGVASVCREAMDSAGINEVAAIGITNQRETTVVWDRKTGEPIHRALVWQDRRTASLCEKWRVAGLEESVKEKTGLRLDPYFSASKLVWILDNVPDARVRAEAGELAFGTIDSFLIWRLTGGAAHVTDVTNASRTMLFNIHSVRWDDELLSTFNIPQSMLPAVRECIDEFGEANCDCVPKATPIRGVAGDQQAALIGQAGFSEGVTKSTYGTGCFVIAHTGTTPKTSTNQLLTTIAASIDGQLSYGLEGSVFVAGSAIQWLRDELRIIDHASESAAIANATGVVDDVHVVPAFTGLGAPYWNPNARGAIVGLSRGSNREVIVTATLQAVAYQTADLLHAMREDGVRPEVIRVDGGMVANDWFLQFLADVLDTPIERPTNVESTVLGAAYLAALGAGVLESVDDVTASWQVDRQFLPTMSADRRAGLLKGWQRAVRQTQAV